MKVVGTFPCLTCCVFLGKWLCLSETQLLHLQSADNGNHCFLGNLGSLDEVAQTRHLAQGLAPLKCPAEHAVMIMKWQHGDWHPAQAGSPCLAVPSLFCSHLTFPRKLVPSGSR
jgi:hypothetical protein